VTVGDVRTASLSPLWGGRGVGFPLRGTRPSRRRSRRQPSPGRRAGDTSEGPSEATSVRRHGGRSARRWQPGRGRQVRSSRPPQGEPHSSPAGDKLRVDEVAGLRPHELAVNRGSTENALKAHAEKETSHGPYCYRSGLEGIAGLRSEGGWRNRGGATSGDAFAGQVPEGTGEEPGGSGGVRGGVQRGGCGVGDGARDGGGAGV